MWFGKTLSLAFAPGCLVLSVSVFWYIPVSYTHLVPAKVEPNGTYAEMKAIGSGSRDWTEEQWDFYRWMYCRLVEDVEQQIGRILAALENSGLADHTIVVFTSDHGEMGQSHGLVFKSRLLEEATRTPLIISGPGVKKDVYKRQKYGLYHRSR